MPEYLSPAVFVEEVSSGIKPIEGVGTSTGAFVGGAVKGPVNRPTLITNRTQFADTFGSIHPKYYLAHAVRHFFVQGGTRCFVTRVFNPTTPGDDYSDIATITLNSAASVQVLTVYAHNPGEWGNNIFLEIRPADPHPDDSASDPDPKFKMIVKFKESPSAIPATVETFDRLSMREFIDFDAPEPVLENPLHVENQINGISKYIEVDDLSEVALELDPPENSPPEVPDLHEAHLFQLTAGSDGQMLEAADYIGSESDGDGLYSFDIVDDINIVAIPDLMTDSPAAARDATLQAITYCQNRKDCFFVADSPAGKTIQEVLDYKRGIDPSGNAFNSTYAALYYPWIYDTDPLTLKRKLFPPSGAIAGTYSGSDVKRGVHKAPAGTDVGVLRAAVEIEREVTMGEHDLLNPNGINVIRKFPDSGIVVWGARTISADSEWKYVNVRRLFLFLEESILKGTQWVVFEPNDPVLWKRITKNVRAFLRIAWLDGMLVGATPDDAFRVICDSETNPPESRDLGRVVTLVGVAPSKPAEFVIFRISQSRSGSEVTE